MLAPLSYALYVANVAVPSDVIADDHGTSKILHFTQTTLSVCNLTWKNHFELSDFSLRFTCNLGGTTASLLIKPFQNTRI